MHLPKLPTIFVKGGEERKAFFTIQAKELLAAGWVEKDAKPEVKEVKVEAAEEKKAPKAESKPAAKSESKPRTTRSKTEESKEAPKGDKE